jgi:uncharacterized protein YukJ
MPLARYGVLKGRPIRTRLGEGQSPHYQVHIIDDTTDYRIAVNVKSKLSPSELLYLVDENFDHPVLNELRLLPAGFTALLSRPGGAAIDFIRGNFFDPRDMRPLPFNVPGPDNDLNERIDAVMSRALADEQAMVYAFGQRWGPEATKKDKYFGFLPGNGIHDIHMNQGNTGQFANDNGVWQDGAMLVQFPAADGVPEQWVGVFLAFQSQAWHTDDVTGHPLPDAPVGEQPGQPPVAGTNDAVVYIAAALVNPIGPAPEHETVTLLNRSPLTVDVTGWSLANRSKAKHALSGTIAAGQTMVVTLPQQVPLSNDGGIITLLDAAGLKVHGVSYTKADAKEGWTIVF